MDEVTHTIMPGSGGWGGTALGAGVGGLKACDYYSRRITCAFYDEALTGAPFF